MKKKILLFRALLQITGFYSAWFICDGWFTKRIFNFLSIFNSETWRNWFLFTSTTRARTGFPASYTICISVTFRLKVFVIQNNRFCSRFPETVNLSETNRETIIFFKHMIQQYKTKFSPINRGFSFLWNSLNINP